MLLVLDLVVVGSGCLLTFCCEWLCYICMRGVSRVQAPGLTLLILRSLLICANCRRRACYVMTVPVAIGFIFGSALSRVLAVAPRLMLFVVVLFLLVALLDVLCILLFGLCVLLTMTRVLLAIGVVRPSLFGCVFRVSLLVVVMVLLICELGGSDIMFGWVMVFSIRMCSAGVRSVDDDVDIDVGDSMVAGVVVVIGAAWVRNID